MDADSGLGREGQSRHCRLMHAFVCTLALTAVYGSRKMVLREAGILLSLVTAIFFFKQYFI